MRTISLILASRQCFDLQRGTGGLHNLHGTSTGEEMGWSLLPGYRMCRHAIAQQADSSDEFGAQLRAVASFSDESPGRAQMADNLTSAAWRVAAVGERTDTQNDTLTGFESN